MRATSLRAWLLVLPLLAGCRDTTPLAENVDFGADAAADAALPSDCFGCIRAACPEVVTACEDTAPCMDIIECSLEIGCGNVSRTESFTCTIPCAIRFQVTSFTDPAGVAAQDVGNCIADLCQENCRTAAGGAGGDGGGP